jgi:hypothetical protein
VVLLATIDFSDTRGRTHKLFLVQINHEKVTDVKPPSQLHKTTRNDRSINNGDPKRKTANRSINDKVKTPEQSIYQQQIN